MADLLPRLGLVLPTGDSAVRVALEVAGQELISAPTVDIIMVAAGERVRALVKGPEPHLLDSARPAEGLKAARESGIFPLLEPRGAEDAMNAGRRFVAEGVLDGLLLLEPLDGPRLRQRGKLRVLEPFPGKSLRWVLEDLDGSELARLLRLARATLSRLGTEARIVAFEVDGAPGVPKGIELARAAGVDVSGPWPPRRAANHPADALLAFTAAQIELPLSLGATGPETCLALESPIAWPTDVGTRTAVLAVDRLLRLLPPVGGSLAAEREHARRPTVSITKKAPAAGRTPEKGRCPYCHLLLGETPEGGGGRPGPPVTCAECNTPHHRDCATDHGRCTTLGCRSTRMLRLGVTIPIARLGSESPREFPFETLEGSSSLGPQSLRVEAPIDDHDARPTRRRLGIELASRQIKRGFVLEGYVVVWAPRSFRVRGAALKLSASLTTRHSRNQSERTEPILGRQATLVGLGPAGALGRFQDGVVSLFSKGTGVAIPAGVRRYPFSFVVDAEHPATVDNRVGDSREIVVTRLEALLDSETAQVTIEVQ